MYSKSLLILAAVSGCCYAQQAAEDVVTGIDSITQNLADLAVLVKAVSNLEEIQTTTTKYRDIVQAESNFSNQAPPTAAFTDAEQEKLCSALETSTEQHIMLLEAFGAQYAVFANSFYAAPVATLMNNDESGTDAMNLQVADMVPACKETAFEKSDVLATAFADTIAQYNT